MRLLLLGSTGQAGRALTHGAAARGWLVAAPRRAALDLRDAAAVAEAVAHSEAEIVVNAAAFTAVDAAETRINEAYAVNAAAPAAMAKACADVGRPFIHLSTDYVFDGAKGAPYREDDAPRPRSIYGASKLAGEIGVAAAMDNYAIIRTSWLYSAHGDNFVNTMLRLGSTRPSMRVVDDQRGRPTSAADLAQAVLAAAEALLAGRADIAGLYHFAGPAAMSWADFAERIYHAAGMAVEVARITTAEFGAAARRPANSDLSSDKFHSVFGIGARPFDAALAEVLAARGGARQTASEAT